MSKKLFSKVFILLLVVGLLFAVAPAKQALAQTVSTWDGTYPAEKPLDMPAVVDGVQEVNTAAQFAWLASQTTMFEPGVTTVKLMVDIDLAEYPWTPSTALSVGGKVLDGNQHTISNLKVLVDNATVGTYYFAAMFVGTYQDVLIKDLTIDGAVIGATNTTINNRVYSAVLHSHTDWYGDLENVTVKNATVYGTKYVAALVGYAGVTDIKNCTVQNVTLNVNEKFKSDGVTRDLPHIGALIGLNNDGDVSGNTVSGLTINLTPATGLTVDATQTGTLIGTAQAEVLVGANNVSGVTLNGTTYSTLIGLDNRTYKVVNATQMLGYTTIQAAIDAAADGDVIEVGAGTYAEDLEIGKSITLLGPNAAISPNTGTRVAEAIIRPDNEVGINDSAIMPTANNIAITIKGITIDMVNAEENGHDRFVTVDFKTDVTMNFEYNQFINGPSPLYGAWYAQGNVERFNLSLIDNYFTGGTHSNGIALWGLSHTVNIRNNVWEDNDGWAMQFKSTKGTISGNQFVERIHDEEDTAWNATQLGIYLISPVNNSYITDLDITKNIFDGIYQYAIALGSDLIGDVDISENTFIRTAGTPDTGIRYLSISPGVDLTNVSIHRNSFLLDKFYFGYSGTETVDLTYNYWGSATGPAAGTFVGVADYIPWCLTAECVAPYGYPEFNGDVSGTFTTSETGAVSGTLTGDYNVTVTGQVSGYVNNNATFTGTVTGDIVGDITASINEMGVGTLAGTVTNTGAILPVRILGIFPQSGTTGDFEGQIITGTVPDLATSMSMTSAGNASTVFSTRTLQMGVVIDPATAAYGQWSLWEPEGQTPTGSTITQDGLLTAGAPGTVVVIAKALDGSLLHATKTITIEPALVSIAPVDPVVCGNTTTTTIDINVAGIPEATPLQAYSFRLHFDETKTSISIPELDVLNGGFVANGGILYTYWIDGSGNISTEHTNILEVVYTQLLPSTTTGDGTLASIKLTHLGVPGDIALSITNVGLSTRDGLVIPSEASATATTLTLSPAVLNTTVDPDAGYCDLDSAVLAASAGDTLQLQADITIPTMVKVTKALTLDLNGKTATVPAGGAALHVTTAAGAFNITDSTSDALGKITGGARAVQVSAGGALTLTKGTLEGTGFDGVFVFGPGSSVTVDGGKITGLYYGISGNGSLTGDYAGSTTIVINDGVVQGGETAIFHPQGGPLTINGGTITGGSYNGIEMKAGDLVITGGTITASGPYNANPAQTGNGNTQTGDAILIYNRVGYPGTMTVDINGGTITSDNGYALREFTYTGETSRTTSIEISGGSFTGGTGDLDAKKAVTFMTVNSSILKITGGLYNYDPIVFVYVPYGTAYSTTEAMYEIVGISLNVTDFYYNNNGILRGVSTDFTATNFVFSDAESVTVRLYSGEEGSYVLQQTNVLKLPTTAAGVLTSSFDYFGTYVSNSWTNTEASTFDITAVPTHVEVTVVLPGGTLTAENTILTGDRTTILPGVNGLVTLQGILAPRAGVPIYLTSGSLVRDTTSTAMTDINYWFTGVETLTYTFTTSQARYLNVTTASGKTFLVNGDKTLNPLRLFGGDVNGDNQIQVNDASLVGEAWGSTVDSAANINYDGIVNIQDLALVGGNFGLTSATAYNWWSPLP